MKRVVCFLLFVSIFAHSWAQDIRQELDSLIATDPLLETSQLGLMVYDLTADTVLYAHNHRQTMRPASTMKLVTAITALDRLSGSYQLKTQLKYTGMVEGRTLRGNLYLIGGMDPMFDITDMRGFVERLSSLGIDTIHGAIVTDCSMKDTLRWGEGWCWDDDNPVLTPLLINRKPNFAERFVTELSNSGIVLDSLTVYEDYTPSDATPIAVCQHPVDQLLLRMMKESDNLYAECLYYQLAGCYGYRPARADYARIQEKQLVKHLGLDAASYRFADGSGLSLYNYVSAELLTMLLRYAWQQPAIFSHLEPSLPVAGEDGTLKKRMKKTVAQGNMKAKTGTLTGIISLAGYAQAANGHQLCFAIINQGVLSARAARDFQDRLCVVLCK